jgi:carboxyl-terminal processing protease
MKSVAFTFALVAAVVAVFALGEHVRLAQTQLPLRQASVAFRSNSGVGAFMVTAKPSESANSFLPAAVADEADSPAPSDSDSNSIADRDIDELLNSDSPAATFQQVYLLLKDQFVDRIDSDTPLAHGAAAALVASLDEPNSRFVDSTERASLEQRADGIYTGIGAEITVRKVVEPGGLIDRQVTIVDALPGSPAQKAGLKTGDIVTTINGHWIISYDPFQAQTDLFKKLEKDPYDLDQAVDSTEKTIAAGFSLDKAQALLDATSPYPLKIVYERPGVTDPQKATLDVSAPTQVKDVEYRKLADGNGYIAFNAFTDTAATDFANALTALGPTKGLVIDLRDCAGGELDPAVEIGSALAPSQPIGTIDVRSDASDTNESGPVPTRTRLLDDPGTPSIPGATYSGPISVLVNKGTANTAELLAAFLHDRMGARIVGASTFGDALAQTLYPLSDGSAIELSTGLLKTDEGVAFNGAGLAPEYALADPGHLGDGDADAGMTKAVALLALGPIPVDVAGHHPVQAAKGPWNPPPTVVASKSTASTMTQKGQAE